MAEFYQKVDALQADIQHRSMADLAGGGFGHGRDLPGADRLCTGRPALRIGRQGIELTRQVQRLSELLKQNGELRRVQRAAANARP